MKQKLTLFLCFSILAACSYAQDSERYPSDTKGSLLGIHFNALDFKTPVSFKNSNSPRIATNLADMDFGASISYWKGLTPKVDFTTKVSAMFHDYKGDQNLQSNKFQLGLELEPTISIRPVSDDHLFSPFLTAGVGAGYYMGDFGAYIPAGVGLQFNFMSTTYLLIQANYRFSLTKSQLKDNILYSIGFAQTLKSAKPKVIPPPPPPAVLDRDNDGVVDSLDKCPDTPGIAALQGCPDRDGDGIADGDDKCPDVKGIAKYQGCPIPDTDGDGVNDEMDKCPNVKGFARYQGCPIPDTDGDGVNDEEDKCPTRPGPATNQGCPVIAKEVVDKINYAAKNIFFATGSSKLLAKSYKSLNEVAKLLADDETLQLSIDGHTDNTGKADKNQTLSEARANAVKTYLASKGVADTRMTATGYGQDKPVADNKTAAGRAKNRRVEMTVKNY